jgi:hypothetical protein
VWEDIALTRREDGSIDAAVRANLALRSDAEAAAAIAWVEAHEDRVAALAADPTRDDEARASFREASRVRELLRVRAYTIEAQRTWSGLVPADRDAILDRVALTSLGRSGEAAVTAIGMILNQLVVARLVALASAAKHAETSAGEAMIGLPIRFQLEVIAETGRDLRVPGELPRVLAGAG